MKVKKEVHDLTEEILNLFDPARLKEKEIVEAGKEENKARDKWDKIEKQHEKEEKMDEINKKDYSKEVEEQIHKMMGCSKDHAAEIDIYDKPYKEKMKRIKLMKEQGNEAIGLYNKVMQNHPVEEPKPAGEDPDPNSPTEILNKASYYYAQALLIFYYLIPDNDEEEKESNLLKISCHLNQSLCYMKLKRYSDCLTELEEVLHRMDPTNIKALYRKAQVYELLGKHD